ncbi:MAG: Ubiquitin-conjugating enzyme E2 6 [Lichina confinis]|nr:MAG: Ubiquitin-conjugating enzyme E2 6 [Lichina confinis]
MATHAASKRLAREYKVIQENPPEYIVAHPSEKNILEWHYIITGPPQTPYHGGQYWGTLLFTPNYPYAPPAIRMHTPSGRFQPSTRLCLSISDFHPKSFNPAWGISTILIGLLSFMTSDEMTTGSISATEPERRYLASRSRWWNSTGGGSGVKSGARGGVIGGTGNAGAIRSGDGGARFRVEWPELHEANLKWMAEHRMDPATGDVIPQTMSTPSKQSASSSSTTCALHDAATLRRPALVLPSPSNNADGARTAEADDRRGWIRRNKFFAAALLVFGYVIMIRILGAEMVASTA